MGLKKVHISKDQLSHYRNLGWSLKRIAEHYECSTHTVVARINEYGLPKNKSADYNLTRTQLEPILFDKRSYYDMGCELGVGSSSIRDYALENGLRSIHPYRGKPKYNVKEEDLRCYVKQGYSVAKIAEFYGCWPRNIEIHLQKYGLRSNAREINKTPLLNKADILPLAEEGLPKYKIAEILGVSEKRVAIACDHYGIKTNRKKIIQESTLKSLVEQNLCKQEICDILGVSRSILNRHLKIYGLKTTNKKGRPEIDLLNRDELQSAINEGLTTTEIAKKLNSFPHRVRKARKHYGI